MTACQASVSVLCSSCPLASKVNGQTVVVSPKYHTENPLQYMIVGEAPAREDIEQGQPFVGPPGKLLREKLEAANIDIDDCLIANSCWCPPRDNLGAGIRNPTSEEADHCIPHTFSLIQKYRPKVIVAVGAVSAKALLRPKNKAKITTIRGRQMALSPTPVDRYTALLDWAENTGSSVAPAETGEEMLAAIENAVENSGYDESWTEIPVFPIVHPSFALRKGRDGKWSESISFDLQRVYNLVNAEEVMERKANYRWINDLDEARTYIYGLIDEFKAGALPHGAVAVDVETSRVENDAGSVGLAAYDPRVTLYTIQFCPRAGDSVSLMVNHPKSTMNDADSLYQLRQMLIDFFSEVDVVGQNFGFDIHVLRCRLGIKKFRVLGDTMLLDHFLQAGRDLTSSLDDIGARYLGTGLHKTPAKIWEEANPGKDFGDMPLALALDYASGDADVTLQAFAVIKGKLEEDHNRWGWYDYIMRQNGVYDVVTDMEWAGMPVDKDALAELNTTYPERIEACLKKIQATHQVQVYLEKVALPEFNAKVLEYNKEVETHNKIAESPDNRKRKRKFKKTIPDMLAWMEDRERWFNPKSVKQVQKIIKMIPVHWDEEALWDIEYSDEDNKFRKTKERFKPGKFPSTNRHNRKILRHYYQMMAKRWREEHNNVDHAFYYDQAAELMTLLDEAQVLSKMFGTYVKGIYPLIIDKPDPDEAWDPRERCNPLYKETGDWPRPWSIHPSYHLNGTETGRLSSSDPNGQNFPKGRMDSKANVKAHYISHWDGEGGIIVQPDYSQIEVRVMVMLAGETQMADAINRGEDIHRFVASLVHNRKPEEVTKAQRGKVKTVTFGIIYGQSVGALAQALGIPKSEAQEIQDTLFARCPNLKAFMDSQHDIVKEHKRVFTNFGRIRWLPHVDSPDKGERGKADRDSVNTPIQSVASDMCAMAFGRTWKAIQNVGIQAYPYSIIHDSQGFDVSPGFWFDIIELQYYQMVWKPYELWPNIITVKPEADFDIGAGWGRQVEGKLFFDDAGEIIHDRITFSGPESYVDLLLNEIEAGGQKIDMLYKGAHRNEVEAEGGKFEAEIKVDRPNPVFLCEGRKLRTLRKLS